MVADGGACSTDTQLSQRYVQHCWSISLANSIMSLLCMSYMDMYVDDIQFVSLTCMLHATKYLSTPACSLPSFWGQITSPGPFWWQEAELDEVSSTRDILLWHMTLLVWCPDRSQHYISGFFFSLGPLLFLETHSASGHAISSCWERQARCRGRMRKRFPGQYKKGRERQTVHRKHGGRTRNRS